MKFLGTFLTFPLITDTYVLLMLFVTSTVVGLTDDHLRVLVVLSRALPLMYSLEKEITIVSCVI